MKDYVIETDLGNYYGSVFFDKQNDEYVMCLNDWDSEQAVSISKEFYEMAKKEFSK